MSERNWRFMNVKKSKVAGYQLVFPEFEAACQSPLGIAEKPTPGLALEHQAFVAPIDNQSADLSLMRQIVSPANLRQACKKVKSNKGSAGIDGMTVEELAIWLPDHLTTLQEQLLTEKYLPTPVRGVQIPKPSGGERQLGIPTVKDRLVQQAISQILEPMFDRTFSRSSYGFRPKRSAHDALNAGAAFVKDGYTIVVDLDLEKFFDRVNHDILMERLSRRITDKTVLRLIRRFLTAGMMQEGVCVSSEEGTPQGGPLSPLLSNILLDELDKELEKRGHRFCRYADDCNIYVRSQVAGERVMASITQFLQKRLKLVVNAKKSAVDVVDQRKFLSYRILTNGRLEVASQSQENFKHIVRKITKRSRGVAPWKICQELRRFITGWYHYFKLEWSRSLFKALDGWIRRRVRCYFLKQCKVPSGIYKFLRSLHVGDFAARRIAGSNKGWWPLSLTPQTHRAMGLKWFKSIGVPALSDGCRLS